MRYYVSTGIGTIGVEAEGQDLVRVDLDRIGVDEPATLGGADPDSAPEAIHAVLSWLRAYGSDPSADAGIGAARIERWLARAGVGGFTARALLELYRLPAGETVTYRELATRAGRNNAARAAGGACARNPFPLLIPCHRVLPAAGGFGAYSAAGGAALKERLLTHEGAFASVASR